MTKCDKNNTDVLEARRIRRKYRDQNLYIIVAYKDGKVHAIQERSSYVDLNRDKNERAMRDAVYRMATLALRHCPDQGKVIRDLRNCGIDDGTMPSIMAEVLEEHGKITP